MINDWYHITKYLINGTVYILKTELCEIVLKNIELNPPYIV